MDASCLQAAYLLEVGLTGRGWVASRSPFARPVEVTGGGAPAGAGCAMVWILLAAWPDSSGHWLLDCWSLCIRTV